MSNKVTEDNGDRQKRDNVAIDEKRLEVEREIELEKIRVERLRVESEIQNRGKERELDSERLKIDRERLLLESNEKKRAIFRNPVTLGLLGAFVGLMSNAVVAWINANKELSLADARASADRTLEREKAESARILEALKSGGSATKAIENLTLLTEAKLAPTYESGLRSYITALQRRRRETGNPELGPGISATPYQSQESVPNSPQALKVFFERYRKDFGDGKLTQKTIDNLTTIFEFIKNDQSVKDLRYVAYILATIKHETNNTFAPIVELGSDDAIEKRYGVGTSQGRRLGNTEPGDGVRYKGRGYVLLTGKFNYRRLGNRLGYDLVSHPEKALEPQIAYQIASQIMIEGYATGRKLSEFITDEKTNYFEARRVTNALDKAALIAGYAKTFEAILKESLASHVSTKSPPP